MVDGTAEVCGAVGRLVELAQVDVNLAEWLLTTRQTESAFQPRDTASMNVHQVLSPELLPKSPLGGRLLPRPEILPQELFSVQAGTSVTLGITEFVTGVLFLVAATGTAQEASLALLSTTEPNMIGFMSFEGGGGVGAPALRLLYTVANDVGLP